MSDDSDDLLDARALGLIVTAILALLSLCIVSLVPMPYALMRPGPVENVLGSDDSDSMIEITGHKTYPTSGNLDLLTVNVSGGPGEASTIWDLLDGVLDPQADVRPVNEVFLPERSSEQIKQANQADMANSQEQATAAALRELNIPFASSVAVASVDPKSKAYGKLEAGDIISTLNGATISNQAVLRSELQKVTPGATVTVGVTRNSKPVQVSVVTRGVTDEDGSKRTVLGVVPALANVKFPFTVKIKIEDIGGPSAGMIFALGIIDKLTPGAMTGGKQVAGTGEIDYVGTVGSIGGIRQKAIGAKDAGAEYFLVPFGNCAEVKGHVPAGLQDIRVATLHEARSAVETIASGDAKKISALPSCG